MTTSDDLETLAHEYESLTAPDIHVDGRLQRALVEPIMTFLGRPNPYLGITVTTSLYYDKAKVYHPGPEWFEHLRRVAPGQGPRHAVAGFSLWRDGGMPYENYAYGETLELAYCAALARTWAWILRQAGR
jgi:hypothetical protein